MKLKDLKVLIFIEKDYEDSEFIYPKYRMLEEGAKVVVAGSASQKEYKGKKGYPTKAEIAFSEVHWKDYDALVIPGGYAPDKLRQDPNVLEIIKNMHQGSKLIAFICHAGWVLISANILK
jgi:protease I